MVMSGKFSRQKIKLAELNDSHQHLSCTSPMNYKTLCTSTQLLLLHTRLHVPTLIIGHLQAFLQLSLLKMTYK